ncbi:DUF6660 family protein [Hymenobacter sp. GOD-10R]|uniref:DUF6660 family protein n=1 Tax=Hymenobacter sp. GOD-10R TaxID=3093922 RepID=UPI003A5CB46C
MRLSTLFFALYFVCLSCLTCADETPVCQDQTQTTVAASSHSDCDTDALGDWCSPLCQCHCCGGAVVPLVPLPALVQASPRVWDSARQPVRFVVAAPTRAPGAIWQPPRA